MCFSADADLVAGIAVSAVGIDAVRRARVPEELPLAVLPLVFGMHQLVEAFVWWDLEGKVSAARGDVAIWIYLAIAFVLPLWVPLAVRGVERSRRRRIVISLLVALGLVVTVTLLAAIVRGPVDAWINGHYIEYMVAIPGGTATGLLYVVATCGALLAASDRRIRTYGVSNLVAVGGLAWLTVDGLTSLWCVWAALTSVAIDIYLREGWPRPEMSMA